MKKLLWTGLMAVLIIGLAAPAALAVPTFSGFFFRSGPMAGDPYSGPVEIKFSGFGLGTSYPTDAMGNLLFPFDGTVGGGDPNGLAAGGANDLVNPFGTAEDAWIVANITSIVVAPGQPGANTPVWQPSATEELTAIVYGLNDIILRNGGQFGIEDFTVGGLFDVYLDNSPDFNASALGPGARTATNMYPTATDVAADADLFFSAQFNPAVSVAVPTATLFQDLTGVTTPFSGQGLGYADITGGPFGDLFDTNTRVDALGNLHDFEAVFDVTNPSGSPAWPAFVPIAGDPFSRGRAGTDTNDPVRGAIPEPASMLLVGSALLGLAAFGRRRNRK